MLLSKVKTKFNFPTSILTFWLFSSTGKVFASYFRRFDRKGGLLNQTKKLYQKLAHSFLHVSVGITFVTIGQAGVTGQRLEGTEFGNLPFESSPRPISMILMSKCSF